MSGALTIVVGDKLAEQLCADLAHGTALVAPEARHASAYTRSLLRGMFRVHLGRDVFYYLSNIGPELTVHQRRSLERVAQGARPLVLREPGALLPGWAGCLPEAPFGEAVSWQATRRATVPGAASSNPGVAFSEALRPTNPGHGTGSWRSGGALLVGDRANPSTASAGFPPWPFISQLREGCSAWLSEQLEAAHVPEAKLYWTNAYNFHGEVAAPLAPLVHRLQPKLVVALGKNAADALSAEGVAHHQVHHPQYWKRYHYRDAYVLCKVLRKGLEL